MDSRISARALAAALGGWRTREPAYEALADGIRLLCLDNRLAPRTALPAERELAGALTLSRSTVAAAYRSLRDTASHREHCEARAASRCRCAAGIRVATGAADGAIDLQQASPPAWPGLAGVMAEVARFDRPRSCRGSATTCSAEPELREAIAERYTRRGIPTSASEVLVTTGAQSAIHLRRRRCSWAEATAC